MRIAGQARKFSGSFPDPVFELVPKSPDTCSDSDAASAAAAVAGPVDPFEAVLAVAELDWELLSAERIILAAVCVESALPNKPFASCNCRARALSCTISPEEALCKADCTAGEDRTVEPDADSALDSVWSKSETPGFTEGIDPIEVQIGRSREFSNTFVNRRQWSRSGRPAHEFMTFRLPRLAACGARSVRGRPASAGTPCRSACRSRPGSSCAGRETR